MEGQRLIQTLGVASIQVCCAIDTVVFPLKGIHGAN